MRHKGTLRPRPQAVPTAPMQALQQKSRWICARVPPRGQQDAQVAALLGHQQHQEATMLKAATSTRRLSTAVKSHCTQ
ncbi:MAG: hypothetical protein IPN91_15875 [Holophagaceae bacterium]|uniref:Uncharacterized protein n=1 Tax=Candidatus Geothrix odensensis TaxID=2954440 RepID=A0A936F533_9BACT|nr:hypothetical protein [Candidatus Geothrix odensensis]